MKNLLITILLLTSASAFSVEVMIFGEQNDKDQCQNSSPYFLYPHLKDSVDLVLKFSREDLNELGQIKSIGAYQFSQRKSKIRKLHYDTSPQFKCIKMCAEGRLYRLTIPNNKFKRSKEEVTHLQLNLQVKGEHADQTKSFSFAFVKEGHEILVEKPDLTTLISEEVSVVSELYDNRQSNEILEITYQDYVSDKLKREDKSSMQINFAAQMEQGQPVSFMPMTADSFDSAGGQGGLLSYFNPIPNTKDIFSLANPLTQGVAVSLFVNIGQSHSTSMDWKKAFFTKSKFVLLQEESGLIVEVLTLLHSKFSKYGANKCGFLSEVGEIAVIQHLTHYEMILVEPDEPLNISL